MQTLSVLHHATVIVMAALTIKTRQELRLAKALASISFCVHGCAAHRTATLHLPMPQTPTLQLTD